MIALLARLGRLLFALGLLCAAFFVAFGLYVIGEKVYRDAEITWGPHQARWLVGAWGMAR
jgi:hypothetical protein